MSKKVITTVGISIFYNCIERGFTSKELRSYIEELKNVGSELKAAYKDEIGEIKKEIENWIKKKKDDITISAEIKSLVKIQERLKNSIDVYLLPSGTVLSCLAAELIKDYFSNNKDIDIRSYEAIKDLQVKEEQAFSRRGLSNLIRRIENITGGYYGNVIFNITGGYKAVIPYMTIMAQINGCDAYYIFEDEKALIKIPKAPLYVDFEEIERNYELLKELENGIEDYPNWRNKNYRKVESIESFIETDGEIAFLSPLGRIFLAKYENMNFIFYAPEDVWKEIKNSKDILRILQTKFHFKEQRESKSEMKNGHLVFDDGNNQNRIFYFEEDSNIYIYKVFTDHSKYESYLNSSSQLDKDKIKKESKSRGVKKLEKEVVNV
ncbi:putative CRISPR-associated protein [Peptococcaceae bacterium]|nr:putative CRISPR-associated protein [Peptococcaceae bacterium]